MDILMMLILPIHECGVCRHLFVSSLISFLKNIFINYAITVVPFPSLYSLPPCIPLPTHIPPTHLVHVHGSYIQVLWLLHFLFYSYPSPIYFLPTIYATYSLQLSPLSPSLTPLLITLHVISISVVLFLFQLLAQFAFVFVLGVIVNNCEFAVILTVHIFYLLFLR